MKQQKMPWGIIADVYENGDPLPCCGCAFYYGSPTAVREHIDCACRCHALARSVHRLPRLSYPTDHADRTDGTAAPS